MDFTNQAAFTIKMLIHVLTCTSLLTISACSSLGSIGSHCQSGGAIVEETTSAVKFNRLSGTTFVNLKQFASTSSCEQEGSHSNRSSIGSSSSIGSCTHGSNGHL